MHPRILTTSAKSWLIIIYNEDYRIFHWKTKRSRKDVDPKVEEIKENKIRKKETIFIYLVLIKVMQRKFNNH
jgi:hypothetical protein